MLLLSGIKMSLDYMHVLRLRNYRLAKMLEKKVVAVVLRFQPDRRMSRVGERPMRAELVRAVMDLVGKNGSSGVEL